MYWLVIAFKKIYTHTIESNHIKTRNKKLYWQASNKYKIKMLIHMKREIDRHSCDVWLFLYTREIQCRLNAATIRLIFFHLCINVYFFFVFIYIYQMHNFLYVYNWCMWSFNFFPRKMWFFRVLWEIVLYFFLLFYFYVNNNDDMYVAYTKHIKIKIYASIYLFIDKIVQFFFCYMF